MKRIPFRYDVWIILIVFLLSRMIVAAFRIQLDYGALERYWQYLDIKTLHVNLLKGVWYDHTQPPVFNLLLGLVLKTSGIHARIIFIGILKLLTLVNSLLLLAILKRTTRHPWLPLIFSLLYLLSPASIIFENELFYTSFITCLLLTSCYFLTSLKRSISWRKAAGFFIPLIIVCLTRSMYHLFWLLAISALVLTWYRKRSGIRILFASSFLSILLVGSWYLKNYLVFKEFSTSTWMGMNIARNVFHDASPADSSKIESIEPFTAISAYQRFLPPGYSDKYAGLEDRVLLEEYKNDSFINEKEVGYITISHLYMQASLREIRTHPLAYAKNVGQSAIIFFAPATRYPSTEYQAEKIASYDVLYSFNLSHFARGKQQRRIALTLSAIPKFLIYCAVFFWFIREGLRRKASGKIPGELVSGGLLTLFITVIITYIFAVSSFFEHYENMRFRYEVEPLFLILAAGALAGLLKKKREVGNVG